jgi:hypothetical protein
MPSALVRVSRNNMVLRVAEEQQRRYTALQETLSETNKF